MAEARMACLDLLRQSPNFDVNFPPGWTSPFVLRVLCSRYVEFMPSGRGGRCKCVTNFEQPRWWARGSPFVAAAYLLIRAGASVTARVDGKTPDLTFLRVSVGMTPRLRDRRLSCLLRPRSASPKRDPTSSA